MAENINTIKDIEILSIKTNKLPGWQSWSIWFVAAIFYLYEMVLRVSPSVMATQLMDEFRVTSTALGVLASFYYYAYVLFQVPCGIVIDKIGPRFIITASCLVCTLGSFMFAQSESLYVAQIGRFLIGLGSACAFIGCLKVTADWFSPAHFALVAGLSNMMGTLGSTLAGSPLAVLVGNVGWRRATEILAYAGIAVTLVCWFIIKDKKRSKNTSNAEKENTFNILKTLFRNPQIILAGCIGGLMYLPISAFSELWAVPFLMTTYGVSSEVAAGANMMVFIGMALGSPFIATLTDYYRSYTKVMKFSAMVTSILFLFISFAEYVPFYTIYLLLFMAGFIASGQVLCFTCAKDNSDIKISGTTVAFTNALVMMSGVIFQPLLGAMLDIFWAGEMSPTGMRIYDQNAYQLSILLLPASLLVSWILLRWVRETYNQDHTA
jgi:predicted MFS family arabinose efflux permease